MEALHDGSSRIPFNLELFFKISLEVMTRQALLKIKHGVQHMFCFEAFKHSSSCILKCNSFYLIFRDGHNCFVGSYIVSPKAFPKECCYCGAYQ